jgi:hypothetical protein
VSEKPTVLKSAEFAKKTPVVTSSETFRENIPLILFTYLLTPWSRVLLEKLTGL